MANRQNIGPLGAAPRGGGAPPPPTLLPPDKEEDALGPVFALEDNDVVMEDLDLTDKYDPKTLRTRLRAVREYFSIEFFDPGEPEDNYAYGNLQRRTRHNVLLGLNNIPPLDTWPANDRDEAIEDAWTDALEAYKFMDESIRLLVLNRQQMAKHGLTQRFGNNPVIWMNYSAYHHLELPDTAARDPDTPLDSFANRWVDIRVRDLSNLGRPRIVPIHGNVMGRDPDMDKIENMVDKQPPPYPRPHSRWQGFRHLVNYTVHGGDLRSDSILLRDNRTTDVAAVANALNHPDATWRKIAEGHRRFIGKTMAAQILSELHAVNGTNKLFEQYTTDFAAFCRSPETASPALIQQIHNR
ncbi:hypothetical protein QBC43DRAFT_338091 [Cladorrhinum sp. PSN259]|nr:hypothetical protein QBC43DRAFT_338091 [Cladorrhinum sp. PSN259]